MNVDGTERRRIGPPHVVADPRDWSPDGRHILVTSEGGQLMLVSPDGSSASKLGTAVGCLDRGHLG
jgi:hypothetical protein